MKDEIGMASPTFDGDVEKLVALLLRKHAKEHNDFRRYNNISSQMSFEIANRGLATLGLMIEPEQPEPKE